MSDYACFLGYTTDPDPLGQTAEKKLFGREICIFPLADYSKSGAVPNLVPGAVRLFYYLWKYRKQWGALEIRKVFTGNYIVLWYFAFLTKYKICYYATGLGNPWIIGRHAWFGKLFSKIYNWIQMKALHHVQLAWAADSPQKCEEWNQYLAAHKVAARFEPIPSVVNTEFFKPLDQQECRKQWDLPEKAPVYMFVGRLAQVKGIDLILQSFALVLKQNQDAILLLAGEGEEKENLLKLSDELGLARQVRFLGRKNSAEITQLLGAANVAVVGSFVEGSSFAMVEQLACGKALVSTLVSGAEDMIKDGVNGFVVRNRNPENYAEKMIAAYHLPDAEAYSRKLAEEHYSEAAKWNTLRERLNQWK